MAGLGLEAVSSLVLYPSIFLSMMVLLVTSDRKNPIPAAINRKPNYKQHNPNNREESVLTLLSNEPSPWWLLAPPGSCAPSTISSRKKNVYPPSPPSSLVGLAVDMVYASASPWPGFYVFISLLYLFIIGAFKMAWFGGFLPVGGGAASEQTTATVPTRCRGMVYTLLAVISSTESGRTPVE